jgi:hypothetical protein
VGIVNASQNTFDVLCVLYSRFGKRDQAGSAGEQLYLQIIFEVENHSRNRRGGDAKLAGSLRKAFVPGNGKEKFHCTKSVHEVSLSLLI